MVGFAGPYSSNNSILKKHLSSFAVCVPRLRRGKPVQQQHTRHLTLSYFQGGGGGGGGGSRGELLKNVGRSDKWNFIFKDGSSRRK